MSGYEAVSIACGLCGTSTPMLGTKRCDRCFELEMRVNAAPALAEKVLGKLDGAQRRWAKLRALMGSVENASDRKVELYQDDATKDFIVRVGKEWWFARTLEQALDQAEVPGA